MITLRVSLQLKILATLRAQPELFFYCACARTPIKLRAHLPFLERRFTPRSAVRTKFHVKKKKYFSGHDERTCVRERKKARVFMSDIFPPCIFFWRPNIAKKFSVHLASPQILDIFWRPWRIASIFNALTDIQRGLLSSGSDFLKGLC